MSLLDKRFFPLENIVAEPVYYCNGDRFVYRYEGNQRTDEIIGVKYLVTNTATYEQLEVFVPGKKALIEPEKLEQLQESGEKVFVEFENAVLKPYYSERTRSIEDSIKADAVKRVTVEK